MEGGLDFLIEINALDIDDWASVSATRMMLVVLGYHPNWDESRELYSRTARWLADVSNRDRRPPDGRRRHFELEADARRYIARFALKLSFEDAMQVIDPLVDEVVRNAKASGPRRR